MVARQQPGSYTVDEWWQLVQETGRRYEYSNGQVYLMAGGSLAHAAIADNVLAAVRGSLRGRGCWAYNSDAAVQLSPTEYRFPDATVTCDERDRPSVAVDRVKHPTMCLEVLSPSTAREDRTTKARLYRACPTIREYGFIHTKIQRVEVFRRTGDVWVSEISDPGELVDLQSVGAKIPVVDIYSGTDVPEAAERQGDHHGEPNGTHLPDSRTV